MRAIILLSVVVALAANTEASCFGKDANFNPALAKPTITQPSKNDATKVMVDWSKILKNEQCVDKFSLLVWPDGLTQDKATKYSVDKNTKSKVVDVQPCVGYNFLVQIGEDNTFGNKVIPSGVGTFKTTALTVNVNLDPTKFEVTYYWDPVKLVVDLRQASIKFPRDLLPGASCLDYIQVTGQQVRSTTGPPLSPGGRSRTFSWSHLGQQSSYNPSIQVGAASTLPAAINSGPSYANVAGKNPGARGPLASQWSSSSSSSSSSLSSVTFPTNTKTINEPNYANTLPRPTGGAAKQVGPIKVQPPFLQPVIEIRVAVEDCNEYDFELKMFAPGSKEVSRVSKLRLPPLADIPGYVPPPLTSVMSITYNAQGKPVYGVKTTSGVNAACLPAYYEAYDAYTHRLENEVGWQIGEGSRVQGLITSTKETLTKSQSEMLKAHGCVCPSPQLEFSSTDAALLKKYPEQFGTYVFEGMHALKPYYKRAQPMGSLGLRSSATASTTTTASPATSTVAPWFLFWDDKEKQWVFGDSLGSTKHTEFGSVTKSPAVCPGDPPANGNWQYKSSVLRRWTTNNELKVVCQI